MSETLTREEARRIVAKAETDGWDAWLCARYETEERLEIAARMVPHRHIPGWRTVALAWVEAWERLPNRSPELWATLTPSEQAELQRWREEDESWITEGHPKRHAGYTLVSEAKAEPQMPRVGSLWKWTLYTEDVIYEVTDVKEGEIHLRWTRDGNTREGSRGVNDFLSKHTQVSGPAPSAKAEPQPKPAPQPVPRAGTWWRCIADEQAPTVVIHAANERITTIDSVCETGRARANWDTAVFVRQWERCEPPPCPSTIKDPARPVLRSETRVVIDNGWSDYD